MTGKGCSDEQWNVETNETSLAKKSQFEVDEEEKQASKGKGEGKVEVTAANAQTPTDTTQTFGKVWSRSGLVRQEEGTVGTPT